MAKEIVDLEKVRSTSARLYNRTQEIVDSQTGEVKTIVTSFLQKEQTKDAFIKVFVENLDFLVENLSNNARTVFLVMIKLYFTDDFQFWCLTILFIPKLNFNLQEKFKMLEKIILYSHFLDLIF